MQSATVCVLAYLFVGAIYTSLCHQFILHLRDSSFIKEIFSLSWPVMIDKSILPLAYIWLARMVTPMGTNAIASYGVIREMGDLLFCLP